MTDWLGGVAPGARPLPEDDATREARHELLATLLGAYADGELPPETAAQIEAHLLGCERCRREVLVQQRIADALGGLPEVAPSDELLTRLMSVTATVPAPPDTRDVADRTRVPATPWWRGWRGVAVIAVLLSVVGVSARNAWQQRAGATAAAVQPVQGVVPILSQVATDFRAVSQRDLPGRARDLESVRRALSFPVTPIRLEGVRLVAAWTVDLDGELAAALAYRWNERLLVQYVVSDAALFRSRDVRVALGQRRAIARQEGTVGLVAWADAQGGSILAADVPWSTLATLAPRPTPP
jgi:anti-sigma factor RsiW